jgi:hypothetical protein
VAHFQESALAPHRRHYRCIMELAEPRVRTGEWQYTNFRTNPILRLQCLSRACACTSVRPSREVSRSRSQRSRGCLQKRWDGPWSSGAQF